MIIEKQRLYNIIDELPEQIDIEGIMYRLYILEKLNAAEKDVEVNRLLSEEEVEQEMFKWFN